jgi:hypothetical protein
MSNSSARREMQLLKLRSYNTTLINALQLRNPASRVHFCSWFLPSVVEGEIHPELTGAAFSTPAVISEL